MLARRTLADVPPQAFFVGSTIFHYLGPAFALLLFARVDVLGVALLRIASAALIFACWRRPWRRLRELDRAGASLLATWGGVLAVMNVCFYEAIARLPLATVAAIESLPVIVLAFCDAALFALHIVLGDRVATREAMGGIDGLAAAMPVAAVVVTPIGALSAAPALGDPIAIAAGIGVGVSSSVLPYVCDQLALVRMTRATYALLVSLLPATAAVTGVLVLTQIPARSEAAGIALVIAGVAAHRLPARVADGSLPG